MMINRNPWFFFAASLLSLLPVLSSCDSNSSLGRRLSRMDYNWELDSEGDFRVRVPRDNGEEEIIVGIGAHSNSLDSRVQVRELWSVAARIPGSLPPELAENLMADSWATRKNGSWALAGTTSDGREVLVYLVRIPENASPDYLRAAIEDAAASAAALNSALAMLEDRP